MMTMMTVTTVTLTVTQSVCYIMNELIMNPPCCKLSLGVVCVISFRHSYAIIIIIIIYVGPTIMCNCFNINSENRTNTQQNEKLVDIDMHFDS